MTVALSTTCRRDSEMCTSEDCPIDESTQSLWMASVVAPPTPLNQTINYDVLNITKVRSVSKVSVHFYSSCHETYEGS